MINSYDNAKVLFKDSELACKCCGELKLDRAFMSQAKTLREMFDRPMHVNSCCRCLSHNKIIGGNPRSLHLIDNPVHPTEGTMAWDIKRQDKEYDDALMELAWDLGWSIGIADTFIHLDRRVDIGLPQTKYWY